MVWNLNWNKLQMGGEFSVHLMSHVYCSCKNESLQLQNLNTHTGVHPAHVFANLKIARAIDFLYFDVFSWQLGQGQFRKKCHFYLLKAKSGSVWVNRIILQSNILVRALKADPINMATPPRQNELQSRICSKFQEKTRALIWRLGVVRNCKQFQPKIYIF